MTCGYYYKKVSTGACGGCMQRAKFELREFGKRDKETGLVLLVCQTDFDHFRAKRMGNQGELVRRDV